MARNVVWIASYPKSGNTWLRFIVSGLLKGAPVAGSGEIEHYTPDAHKHDIRRLPLAREPLFIKTHWLLHAGIPFYRRTAKALYILRHPGDALMSNLAYLKAEGTRRDSLISQFVYNGGLYIWQTQGFGTWIENVESWCATDHPFPRLVLTYESLLAGPEAEIRRIARFLDLEANDAQVAAIVEASSFEAMKALEISEKEAGASPRQSFFAGEDRAGTGRTFMRTGRAGRYAEELPPQRRADLERTFRKYLDSFYP